MGKLMAGSKAIYKLYKPVVAPAVVQQMQSYHQMECSKLKRPDGAAEDRAVLCVGQNPIIDLGFAVGSQLYLYWQQY